MGFSGSSFNAFWVSIVDSETELDWASGMRKVHTDAIYTRAPVDVLHAMDWKRPSKTVAILRER